MQLFLLSTCYFEKSNQCMMNRVVYCISYWYPPLIKFIAWAEGSCQSSVLRLGYFANIWHWWPSQICDLSCWTLGAKCGLDRVTKFLGQWNLHEGASSVFSLVMSAHFLCITSIALHMNSYVLELLSILYKVSDTCDTRCVHTITILVVGGWWL